MADPVVVAMINYVALLLDAYFVTASSVRRNYRTREDYQAHMNRMGLDGNRLHEDWETCRSDRHRLKREIRIQNRLDRNIRPVGHVVVFDDIAMDFQKAVHVVQTDSRKGMVLDDLNKALAMVGFCFSYYDTTIFESAAPVWERYPHAVARPVV